MERKREGHAISEAMATLARRKALAFGVLELLQHPQVKLSQVLSNSRIRLLWSRISGSTRGTAFTSHVEGCRENFQTYTYDEGGGVPARRRRRKFDLKAPFSFTPCEPQAFIHSSQSTCMPLLLAGISVERMIRTQKVRTTLFPKSGTQNFAPGLCVIGIGSCSPTTQPRAGRVIPHPSITPLRSKR